MESMHVSLILIGISVLYPRTGALHKLDKPVLIGPSVAIDRSVVDFYCEIPGKPATLPVLYELYVETNQSKVIGEHISQSGEIATFPLVITTQHDGRLICKASGHNNTDIESSISEGLNLKVIVPVKGVRIISHPSSNNMWEGQTLTLQCKKTKGTYVSYNWLLGERPVEMAYDRTNDTLIIHRLSARNTGHYMCVASNRFNDTTTFNSSSDLLSVQVKEYVSKPEISVEVEKLKDGGFKAVISCRSEKGTPLITFSLLNNTDIITTETSDKTSTFFSVPLELNRYMGHVRCNASNEGNWVLSEPADLTVESVGGAVTMTPVTHTGRDFQVVGLVLRCKVERGTFPFYSWFLNNSRLEDRGGFYAVTWSDNSVLMLSVGQDSAGFYHCEASDRFDNSTSIRSPRMLINKEVLNRVSPVVAVVVFTCFAVLNVALMACCIYGVVLRRRYSGKYSLINQRRKMEIAVKQEDKEEDDDYLEMLEGYEEDVVLADRISDSGAEDEDESVDETLLYEGTVSK
ncbi:basement membrane proteoglycan isoform X1 [Megalobrama amblycephala]|uniref:basement membrane proteoglycan isoform X1 n=1 Tax=Megalobrama amblycephala TaxID=75352 RepID=UPI0020148296|nr:basement membrane proteoglycan isoform X1 [Megalobrama amblycephala]